MPRTAALLKAANLALLVLYPVAWTAPLLRAGLLPLFGLEEISVLTGLRALWQTEIFLAVLVALFALIAPLAVMGFMKEMGLGTGHEGLDVENYVQTYLQGHGPDTGR